MQVLRTKSHAMRRYTVQYRKASNDLITAMCSDLIAQTLCCKREMHFLEEFTFTSAYCALFTLDVESGSLVPIESRGSCPFALCIICDERCFSFHDIRGNAALCLCSPRSFLVCEWVTAFTPLPLRMTSSSSDCVLFAKDSSVRTRV